MHVTRNRLWRSDGDADRSKREVRGSRMPCGHIWPPAVDLPDPVRAIRAAAPDARIIVLTVRDDHEGIYQASKPVPPPPC